MRELTNQLVNALRTPRIDFFSINRIHRIIDKKGQWHYFPQIGQCAWIWDAVDTSTLSNLEVSSKQMSYRFGLLSSRQPPPWKKVHDCPTRTFFTIELSNGGRIETQKDASLLPVV